VPGRTDPGSSPEPRSRVLKAFVFNTIPEHFAGQSARWPTPVLKMFSETAEGPGRDTAFNEKRVRTSSAYRGELTCRPSPAGLLEASAS